MHGPVHTRLRAPGGSKRRLALLAAAAGVAAALTQRFSFGRGLTIFAAVVAVFLFAGGSAVGDVGSGNSANAQLCQQDGWLTLSRMDATRFVNGGACVTYAAFGGNFTSLVATDISTTTTFQLHVEGFGLKPGTDVTYVYSRLGTIFEVVGTVGSDGRFSADSPSHPLNCDLALPGETTLFFAGEFTATTLGGAFLVSNQFHTMVFCFGRGA